MDTKWNNTDKDPGEALEAFVAEEVREAMGTGGAAKLLRPGGRVKALAGFLAFFLGMTLVLSSLCAAGDRIVWERGPSPRWEWDWQETDAFRDEVSRYLREFLAIGAGGEVDSYGGLWAGYDNTYSIVQEEAVRGWLGFGSAAEAATAVDMGMVTLSEQDVPAKPEEKQEPDAAYQADKNVLYFIESAPETEAERKIYTNVENGRDFFLEAERLRYENVIDWSQVPQVQKEYNFFLTFRDGKVSIVHNGQDVDVYAGGIYTGDSQWFVPGYDNFPISEELEGVTVCMAVRQTPIRYFRTEQNGGVTSYNGFYHIAQQVDENWQFYRTQLWLFISGLLCLGLWGLLWKATGPANRKIASWTAHVWTEVRFLLVLGCAAWTFLPGLLGMDMIYEILYSSYGNGGYSFVDWGMAVLRLALVNFPGLIALYWLWWLLRNDHKYNPKEARRSLLRPFLGKLQALFRFLRARDLKRPVEKRLARNHAAGLAALGLLALAELANLYALIYQMFFSGLGLYLDGEILFIQIPLALLGIPLFAALLRAWKSRGLARDIAALADQVESVRAGDLERPLVLPEDADLRRTAERLNDIQAGMRAAVAEQTRSERMKVELVSNVSHDLKTPLTSILSYAELLRQEDLPPAAADYAKIIDQKAQRLKTMVEDVFEVSKAAADQLPVHLERLDLNKLLRQTLADMDGVIQASALTVKVELPETPVMITADGKRLYRVFQNLLDNALRYALEGSRVYLRLKTTESAAEASVRNTSRSELPEGVDFTARFVRGDASRTDGGSGLGLSIAKSFTEACGGEFRVETLADLFTAIVTFPVEETGERRLER